MFGLVVTHRISEHGFDERHFPCNKCSYVGNTMGHLSSHIKLIHEGFKFTCGQCGGQYSNIRKHISTAHEKKQYKCDLCDHQTTRPDYLKDHVNSKHKGIKYYCDKSAYSCKSKQILTLHIRKNHLDNYSPSGSTRNTLPLAEKKGIIVTNAPPN